MDKLELITVYTAQGMLTAEIIRGKLESAGIPALLAYESVGPIYGLTVDGLGQVRVQTPARFAEDALALIHEDESSQTDEADPAGENDATELP